MPTTTAATLGRDPVAQPGAVFTCGRAGCSAGPFTVFGVADHAATDHPED